MQDTDECDQAGNCPKLPVFPEEIVCGILIHPRPLPLLHHYTDSPDNPQTLTLLIPKDFLMFAVFLFIYFAFGVAFIQDIPGSLIAAADSQFTVHIPFFCRPDYSDDY
jgi:hypothetical protein